MSVNIWLEYRNNQKVLIPVNPEKIKIMRSGKNDTVEIVESGEVNLLKKAGLKEIEFESFIPVLNRGGYVEKNATVYSPKFYIDFFEAVQNQKEPLRLVITGLDINIQVSLEDFEYFWEAPDDDMHYSINLKEYKQFKAKVATIVTPKATNTAQKTALASQSSSTRQNTTKKLAVGSKVRVNGTLRQDSYGSNPGVTEKNAIRKVHIIVEDSTRPYPIHITTLDGGWRGWVKRSECEVIE